MTHLESSAQFVLTVSFWTSLLSGNMLTPPAGFFTTLSANCFSTFLAKSVILCSTNKKIAKLVHFNVVQF